MLLSPSKSDPLFHFLSPEHQNLQQRYDKKERECEAKNKEKEDMMEMLNKMKEKLEREITDHKQAKLQLAQLSAQLQQLTSVRPPPVYMGMNYCQLLYTLMHCNEICFRIFSHQHHNNNLFASQFHCSSTMCL